MLSRVQALFPFFDAKALDAGRFFFGNPDTEVYTFQGHRTLTDFIEELEENKFVADMLEPLDFDNIPNYQYIDKAFRDQARLDAKSLLSLCSLELHAPVTLCPDTAGDLTAFCADIAPFLV